MTAMTSQTIERLHAFSIQTSAPKIDVQELVDYCETRFRAAMTEYIASDHDPVTQNTYKTRICSELVRMLHLLHIL